MARQGHHAKTSVFFQIGGGKGVIVMAKNTMYHFHFKMARLTCEFFAFFCFAGQQMQLPEHELSASICGPSNTAQPLTIPCHLGFTCDGVKTAPCAAWAGCCLHKAMTHAPLQAIPEGSEWAGSSGFFVRSRYRYVTSSPSANSGKRTQVAEAKVMLSEQEMCMRIFFFLVGVGCMGGDAETTSKKNNKGTKYRHKIEVPFSSGGSEGRDKLGIDGVGGGGRGLNAIYAVNCVTFCKFL